MDSFVFPCQLCHARLTISGLEHISEKLPSSTSVESSASEPGVRVEESFVLLEHRKGQKNVAPNRTIEDSFVVLGPASLMKPGLNSGGDDGKVGFDFEAKRLRALARLLEMASDESGVDHPLCVDCASQLRERLESQKKEIETEIAEYSAAVKRLEEEGVGPMSSEDFEKEIAQAREECECERKRAELLESQVEQAEKELMQLEAMAEEIDELEERYWHDFNDYHFQLQAHVEEKAALVNKTSHASEKLAWLKHVNVYNDAFRISYDGPFGTISGFRLGRTPEIQVEWDEINCGWGQAVLLLHTMARTCRMTFSSCHLLPLGSRPKVVDKRSGEGKVHELFGPAPKYWRWTYDKAMVCYLGCLKEFADFAHAKDMAEGKEEPFTLPFAIEGDRVNGMTIKSNFIKDARWTAALKYMLANLYRAMEWFIEREARQSGSSQEREPRRNRG